MKMLLQGKDGQKLHENSTIFVTYYESTIFKKKS